MGAFSTFKVRSQASYVRTGEVSLGKAAGADEVTDELLKFGSDSFWGAVVGVCREQWLLLTEVAPGEVVTWSAEWCVGLLVCLRKKCHVTDHMRRVHDRRPCEVQTCDNHTWLKAQGSEVQKRATVTRRSAICEKHASLSLEC